MKVFVSVLNESMRKRIFVNVKYERRFHYCKEVLKEIWKLLCVLAKQSILDDEIFIEPKEDNFNEK